MRPQDPLRDAHRSKELARQKLLLHELESAVFRARTRPVKLLRDYFRFYIFGYLSTRKHVLPPAAVEWFAEIARRSDPMRGLSGFEKYEEDVLEIERSGRFRKDFYNLNSEKRRTDRDSIQHYVRNSSFQATGRKPMPGFHPHLYSQHIGEGVTGNIFSNFLKNGQPKGPWLTEVIQGTMPTRHSTSSQLRIALHLHVFYPELIPDILDRLRINSTRPDLFVSCPASKVAAVDEALKPYEGRIVKRQEVPNVGRDIGPLITQFGAELVSDYDIIGHIHTKNSIHFRNRQTAETWQSFLLENLVGGRESGKMMDTIFAKMEIDPTIGAVFPDDPNVYGWDNNRSHAEAIAPRLGLGSLPEYFCFPAGTMFWMRRMRLRRFVDLDLTWGDYPAEPIPLDGTILHALERLFGIASRRDDDRNVVTNVRGVTKQ